MPAKREDVVRLARSCLGTPFRHQGRLPGHGLDCAGLVIYLSNALELSTEPYVFTGYSHFPAQHKVQYELSQHLDRIHVADAMPADVVLIADDDNHSCHMGILACDAHGEATLIHAAARYRAVVEQNVDNILRRRWRAVFRFRGLRD